ncbi:hypothetical protein GCM10027048_09100 [Hymenobacter coalescens]
MPLLIERSEWHPNRLHAHTEYSIERHKQLRLLSERLSERCHRLRLPFERSDGHCYLFRRLPERPAGPCHWRHPRSACSFQPALGPGCLTYARPADRPRQREQARPPEPEGGPAVVYRGQAGWTARGRCLSRPGPMPRVSFHDRGAKALASSYHLVRAGRAAGA